NHPAVCIGWVDLLSGCDLKTTERTTTTPDDKSLGVGGESDGSHSFGMVKGTRVLPSVDAPEMHVRRSEELVGVVSHCQQFSVRGEGNVCIHPFLQTMPHDFLARLDVPQT